MKETENRRLEDKDSTDHIIRKISRITIVGILLFMLGSMAVWAMISVRENAHIQWFPDIFIIVTLSLVPAIPPVLGYWFVMRYLKNRERSDGSMIRQLEERVSYYTGIGDSSQSGYLVFDKTHFLIIDTNPAASIILGGTHASLIGTDIRELFSDITWSEKDLAFRQSEIQVSLDSGQTIFILATLANLVLPHQELAFMSFIDITRRMKIDEALQESRSRFQTLFHNVPIGLYQSTADGLFLEANNTLADMLGFPDVATLLTTPIQELYEEANDRKEITKALSTKEGVIVKEIRLKRRSGTLIWVRITVHATPEDHSGIRFLEGAIQDITEQKSGEIEAETMNQIDLRNRKMDTIGTLAGGVAHEFNNILTGMKLRIQVCRAKDSGEQNKDDLDYFEAAADRADTHVEGLLAVAGEPLDQTSNIDINTIVIAAVEKARRAHGDHVKWLEYHSSKALNVLADPHQIAFILEELLQNAVNSIGNKGKVTVYCAKKIPGRVMSGILSVYDVPHAAVIIQDNGRGMPQEFVDRAFEPFFTTEEFGAGRGLGLTKIYGIIRQHQGGIVLHSKPGVGTTVMAFLPLAG
jgi:PAS domain S-box-containing protein